MQFYRSFLHGEQNRAVRAVFWSPLPWEAEAGGVESDRLALIRSDLKRLLIANNVDTESWTPNEWALRSLRYLVNALPRQLDKVLTFDSPHDSGRRTSREITSSSPACPTCGKQMATRKRLVTHRVRAHGYRDPLRAQVRTNFCPACRTEFGTLENCKHHYQNRSCIESQVAFLMETIADGDGDLEEPAHAKELTPFPRKIRSKQEQFWIVRLRRQLALSWVWHAPTERQAYLQAPSSPAISAVLRTRGAMQCRLSSMKGTYAPSSIPCMSRRKWSEARTES